MTALLDDLAAFQEKIAGGLKEINQINQNLQRDTDKLLFGEAEMCA